jgi:hypothetical protein
VGDVTKLFNPNKNKSIDMINVLNTIYCFRRNLHHKRFRRSDNLNKDNSSDEKTRKKECGHEEKLVLRGTYLQTVLTLKPTNCKSRLKYA